MQRDWTHRHTVVMLNLPPGADEALPIRMPLQLCTRCRRVGERLRLWFISSLTLCGSCARMEARRLWRLWRIEHGPLPRNEVVAAE